VTPTYDEQGRPATSRIVRFGPPLQITHVVVTHNAVSFFDTDVQVLQVARPTYPGAGLALDLDESVPLVKED